jgi:tRNA1Val (adenine37-N6)-methyltransferase
VELTRDSLFDGELYCVQHRDGYRFSIDPVLLAHFVRLGKEETILDLGAGCGVIGLILLYRFSSSIASLTAFELQTGLAGIARENCEANTFQQQMEVVEGDLRNIKQVVQPGLFSTVVCNPPFYVAGSGRKSQNKEAEIARHQVSCTLAEIITAAEFSVKNRGKVYLIYPADALGSLLIELEKKHLTVKRLQLIYSYPDPTNKARLLMVEAIKNGGEGMAVLAPFYIYDEKDGAYSEAMQQFYSPNYGSPREKV